MSQMVTVANLKHSNPVREPPSGGFLAGRLISFDLFGYVDVILVGVASFCSEWMRCVPCVCAVTKRKRILLMMKIGVCMLLVVR